jgi:hypothetical protein
MINAAIRAPLHLPNFMETLLYPTGRRSPATAHFLLATGHCFVLTSQELEKL